MIDITFEAAEKVKEIIKEKGIEKYLRINIIGGGCAGFLYDLKFDDKKNEDDEVFEVYGVKIICDMISYSYLDRATIDYQEDNFQSGFRVDNPNAMKTCGCGMSFGF